MKFYTPVDMEREQEWSAKVASEDCEKRIRERARWLGGGVPGSVGWTGQCLECLLCVCLCGQASLTVWMWMGKGLGQTTMATSDKRRQGQKQNQTRTCEGPGSGAALLAVVGLHHTVADLDDTNPLQAEALMEPDHDWRQQKMLE